MEIPVAAPVTLGRAPGAALSDKYSTHSSPHLQPMLLPSSIQMRLPSTRRQVVWHCWQRDSRRHSPLPRPSISQTYPSAQIMLLI